MQREKESVWDYPRPPRLERSGRLVRVEFGGKQIARSGRAMRVLETSHPPVYYLPPEDIRMEFLIRTTGGSYCEWKGDATYFDLVVANARSERAAWIYEHPTAPFAALAGFVAFYPGRVDACYLDDECVRPQPGDFYGGWITDEIVGPFKGPPGTSGW